MPWNGARDEDVAALGAALTGAVEALARVRRRHAGFPEASGRVAAVDHGEALSAQAGDVELIGSPGREPDDLLDRRVLRDGDGDGAAHREADKRDATRADGLDRRPRIVDAHDSSRRHDFTR